jgi:hypothetical protein
MSERKAYPLSWPEGWKRTTSRTDAQFGKTKPANYVNGVMTRNAGKNRLSVADAVGRVLLELGRMAVPDWNVIISTNVPLRLDGFPRSDKEPADPGACVYWKKQESAVMRCMAIDRYTRVADNLAAIAATLEAMRAIERHGGGQILERAFLGFAALPEKASQPWRDVLGIAPEMYVNRQVIEDRFRELVKTPRFNPENSANVEAFQSLLQAREAARMELSA